MYVVSFAEWYTCILSVLQRTFLYMHQRHLVNLVETVPNILHFRSEEVKIMFFSDYWLTAEV